MTRPILKNLGAYYEIVWQEHDITARLARLKEHSDGRLTAQLTLTTTDNGHYPHLTQQQINLSSAEARNKLRKTVEPRYKRKVPWDMVIEQMCVLATDEYHRGEPIQEIGLEDDTPDEPEWLLSPIIYKDVINLMYGDGGAGKSLLSAALSICVQLPFYDNPLNLGVPDKMTNVLWLDYEGGRNPTHRNIKWLAKGFGVYPVTIRYRFGYGAFIDDFEDIKRAVSEWNIDFIVLDAIGGAIGSANMNDPQTATQLCNAVRSLGITSLLITHQSKADQFRKTAFGSVYFRNQARNAWEVRKEQEPGDSRMTVGLKHDKCNLGDYQKPQGFVFEFGEGRIDMSRTDATTMESLQDVLPAKSRIRTLLLQLGALSLDSIYAQLPDISQGNIRQALKRGESKGAFVQFPDKRWGVCDNSVTGY